MYKSVILLMENKCIWRIEIGICNIIQAYQNFLRIVLLLYHSKIVWHSKNNRTLLNVQLALTLVQARDGYHWVWTGRRSWRQTARRPVRVSVQVATYWLKRKMAWTKIWRQKQETHSVFNTTEHKASEILSASLIKSKMGKWCLMPSVCWRILQNELISNTRHPATFSMTLVKTQPILIETFRDYSQFLQSKVTSLHA